MKEFFDNIVCINLERRRDRKIHMLEMSRKFDIPIRFHKAIDAQHSPLDQDDEGYGYKALLETCITIADKYIRLGVNNILILEDDTAFVDGANNIFNDNLKYVPKDWDVLHLGYRDGMYRNIRVGGRIKYLNYATLGHAFAVSKKMLPLWRDRMMERNLQSDLCLPEIYRGNPEIKAYGFSPSIAYQIPGFSDNIGVYVDNSETS